MVVKENSAQYLNMRNISTPPKSEPSITELVDMIKNFDLANSSPMQGLNFIQQLKMEAQKVEENNGNI